VLLAVAAHMRWPRTGGHAKLQLWPFVWIAIGWGQGRRRDLDRRRAGPCVCMRGDELPAASLMVRWPTVSWIDHSTSRITLSRFVRSSACTTSFLSSSHRVMRPRFDKLSQDAPTVLNGANEYEDVLVGTFHKCTQLSGRGKSSELASRSLAE
jgi:hypothetical protein